MCNQKYFWSLLQDFMDITMAVGCDLHGDWSVKDAGLTCKYGLGDSSTGNIQLSRIDLNFKIQGCSLSSKFSKCYQAQACYKIIVRCLPCKYYEMYKYYILIIYQSIINLVEYGPVENCRLQLPASTYM